MSHVGRSHLTTHKEFVMRWTRIFLSVSAVVALSGFLAPDARAQRPGGFGFGGFQQDPISLLRNQAIRRELEIEADQEKQIEAVRQELEAELTKSRREITAKYQEKIDKVLQPQQVERLQQISLQLRGLTALTDPEVAKKLGLSDSQVKDIQTKREEGNKKIAELRQGGGGFNRETFEKTREIQQETDKSVLGVLSEDQQKKYETLKGKEFDRSQLFPGRKKNPDT
jgi:hypothetical protein